jgi:uncharacterized glyoxalase superfamily protein PhnB
MISPMLAYENVGAAADWLADVFGLEEVERYSDDGRVSHCVMTLGDGTIHLGDPGHGYESPRHHAETCERAARWRESPYIIDGVLAEVPDVSAHYERAKARGATIVTELETTGRGARYRAEDREGHRWMFTGR